MRRIRLSQLSLAALSLALVAAAPTPAPSYEVAGSIAGPDGGWDYASVDPAGRTLYVAHGEAVMAVDLANGNAVRSLGTIAKAHAVVPIPGTATLIVSSAHDDTVRLLDTGDGHEIARIAVGSDPDAAFYDPASGRAVVMNAKGGTVSLIDVAARKVVGTITLKPGLEFAVMGEGSTLFVNNEDTNEIAVADLASGKVGASIPLTGCEGPTGLGYDAATHQLISACANGKAVVVNAQTRRVVRLLDIGKGPDAVIMDTARRLAFIPCGGSGSISIVSLDGKEGAAIAGTVTSEPGARTGALDPATGKLFLPTARFAASAAQGGRPVAKPGSFHVLIVAPK